MRTWTIEEKEVVDSYIDVVSSGPELSSDERVKVVELDPMLDLLEDLLPHHDMEQANKLEHILRENGRLQ